MSDENIQIRDVGKLFRLNVILLILFQSQGLDSVVLLESIFCGLWAWSLVLVLCEAGQQMIDTFGEIEEAFEQIDWYLLPIEIQRMMPQIIMYAQEPMVVRFFGSV